MVVFVCVCVCECVCVCVGERERVSVVATETILFSTVRDRGKRVRAKSCVCHKPRRVYSEFICFGVYAFFSICFNVPLVAFYICTKNFSEKIFRIHAASTLSSARRFLEVLIISQCLNHVRWQVFPDDG